MCCKDSCFLFYPAAPFFGFYSSSKLTMMVPKKNGTALITVKPFDRQEILPIAQRLQESKADIKVLVDAKGLGWLFHVDDFQFPFFAHTAAADRHIILLGKGDTAAVGIFPGDVKGHRAKGSDFAGAFWGAFMANGR